MVRTALYIYRTISNIYVCVHSGEALPSPHWLEKLLGNWGDSGGSYFILKLGLTRTCLENTLLRKSRELKILLTVA